MLISKIWPSYSFKPFSAVSGDCFWEDQIKCQYPYMPTQNNIQKINLMSTHLKKPIYIYI